MTVTDIGHAVDLWRYPVSSTGGERLASVTVESGGLQGDRLYALVEAETGNTVNPSQKRWQMTPNLLSRLGPDGHPVLSLDGETWQGPESPGMHAALEETFGCPVRLRPYAPGQGEAGASHRYPLAPIHLVSRQALEALGRLLPDGKVDLRRFRPNVVVDMPATPGKCPEYILLNREFSLGGVRMRGVAHAGRCSFTTLAQFGLPSDRAVLQALIAKFGRNFGIYCEVIAGGALQVGDRLSLPEPPATERPVTIIGAGQAGGTLAQRLRALGHVGPITLFGEERHAPYERPPLSKSFAPPPAPAATPVLAAEMADKLNIALHLGQRVVGIDRAAKQIETQDGARHDYDRLVLATGGTARRLPHLQRGFGRILSLRTLDDADRLQRAMVNATEVFILGSGWLGLEIAAAVRALDIRVTVFARTDRLCSAILPEPVSDVLKEMHRERGVRFVTGTNPRFKEHEDRVTATWDGENASADLLVLAIGMTPDIHLARHAGLECDDGILTDANGAAADPDIFAIGDISRQRSAGAALGYRLESWQNAVDQANRAAAVLVGGEAPPPALPRFWSDQYGKRLQIVGWPNPQATPTLTADGYWEFGNFAIGLDQPRRLRDFETRADARPPQAPDEPVVETDPVATGMVRHVLSLTDPVADSHLCKIAHEELGDLVVTRVGGRLYAMSDRCPHAEASLSEGLQEGHRVICPLHFAEFDLRDGSVHNGPAGCAHARVFPVTVENGQTYVWGPT